MLSKKQLYELLKETESKGKMHHWDKYSEDYILLDINNNKDMDMIYDHYIFSLEEKNKEFYIGTFDYYWTFAYKNDALIKIIVTDAWWDGGIEWKINEGGE